MVHFSSSEKRVKGDLDDVGNVDNVGAYIHKSNRKVTIKNISEIYTGEGAMGLLSDIVSSFPHF